MTIPKLAYTPVHSHSVCTQWSSKCPSGQRRTDMMQQCYLNPDTKHRTPCRPCNHHRSDHPQPPPTHLPGLVLTGGHLVNGVQAGLPVAQAAGLHQELVAARALCSPHVPPQPACCLQGAGAQAIGWQHQSNHVRAETLSAGRHCASGRFCSFARDVAAGRPL